MLRRLFSISLIFFTTLSAQSVFAQKPVLTEDEYKSFKKIAARLNQTFGKENVLYVSLGRSLAPSAEILIQNGFDAIEIPMSQSQLVELEGSFKSSLNPYRRFSDEQLAQYHETMLNHLDLFFPKNLASKKIVFLGFAGHGKSIRGKSILIDWYLKKREIKNAIHYFILAQEFATIPLERFFKSKATIVSVSDEYPAADRWMEAAWAAAYTRYLDYSISNRFATGESQISPKLSTCNDLINPEHRIEKVVAKYISKDPKPGL